ncbi:protein asteroid homolog 1 [Micropterus salmoides]|uniref:protein asteroid homolog 1 n=1 Tax=Micropterus salmoides TaxID=27706 RepID=UPI0018ECD817|nr:protein asteroid homolog 1 [Micropterus salmoides]
MGVKGLATLLDSHREIYRDVRFRQRRLVIDGCNLIYQLYFQSGLDQNHGGEYAAFEELIEKFIKALRECLITPYVVMDGGTDQTDKKLETLTQRAKDRARRAHQAMVSGRQENILPQMFKLVFKQTLTRLQIPLAQCFGEADQEIAALANEWECPVLSNDSDFYIFDLPAGLLPISHFQWQAVKKSGSQSYIPCKSYNASSFCTLFNIQRQLLPIFAALAGNDYVKLQKMESSISWAQFSRESSGTPGHHLEGLIGWLRGFQQPQEALEAVLGLLGGLNKKKKEEVLQGMNVGIEEYKIPPSSLKRFFIHGIAPPFPAEEKVAGLVPDWARLPLTQAQLTPDVLDVLLLQRMPLGFPVDHADFPSSNLISRPLRQVMYGLLLGRRGALQVEERDRDGLQLKFIKVKPVFTPVTQRLKLNLLDKVEPSQRLQVLLEALGVTEASLSHLPPQLRLPVAATCFWLQNAQPPLDESQLKALLLGLSNGDALRHRAGLQTTNQVFKERVDVGVAHAFNEWQACLKNSIHLNQLLGFPLAEPQVSQLYEGTLIHQMVHRMRTGGKLRLKSDPSSVKLYQSMLAVVHQFHPKVASTPQRQHLDDLTTNLQQLFLLHEYDEETPTEISSVAKVQLDLHLDDLLSIKTRYRAKERNNRCKNPELARKAECRGQDLL